jgi:methionyl aminopeptidase
MIVIKNEEEIAGIRKSSRLAARVLEYIAPFVKVGVETNELDRLCHEFIVENGASPSPLGYNGFPKSICTSVNQVVCHGIPSSYTLKEGDIVNVDVTTYLGGFHGDTSKTFLVGKTSRAARDLVKAAEDALFVGIEATHPGGHIGDIGEAIGKFVTGKGYSVVREYCGHGIGRKFHEDPHVVHVGRKGTGPEIRPGMVFTIEPMINQGTDEIILLDDNWTVETVDGKLSAQFEHTIAIHNDHVEILTKI